MANAETLNVAGALMPIADATARATANSALSEAEYERQESLGTYAGRSLASLFAGEIAGYASPWHWLRARVRANNMSGIRIGDYIDLTLTDGNNVRYLVGAYDPYYLCGDSTKGHHAVMVPSAPVAVTGEYAVNGSNVLWNTTNTNQGTDAVKHPYLASNLHAWEEGAYYPSLPQNVRDNIMVQRVLLDERYSASGALTEPSNWSWADLGHVWSLSEMEVYGTHVWSKPGHATGFDCQLPLFKQTKNRINGNRVYWWLRSVSGSSSSYVCYVSGYGPALDYAATSDWIRARPCFLVG